MAKNKMISALLLTILCVVLSTSVSALSVGSITGSAMQGDSFEGVFTITNNEAVNITSISLVKGTLTSGTSTISTSDISVSPTSIAKLNVAAVSSVTYKVTTKETQTPGTYIGTVAITYSNGTVQTTNADISFTVVENPNKLVFKKIDLEINGKKKSVDPNDDFDVKYGDDISLTVEVENLFTRDEDQTIENVEICVYNNDLDWDECEDIGDLKYGRDDSYTFDFTIGYDVDSQDSPFTIEVSATGEDEDNNDHEDYLEFDLNLDKERDEITITDLSISPSVVSCDDNSVRLTVELTNTGKDDESTAVLQVVSDELDFEQYIRNINLDEDERNDYFITIPLDNAKNGEVLVDVYAYATSTKDDLTSVETTSFMVSCADTETPVDDTTGEETNDNGSTIEIVAPTNPTTTPVQTSVGQKRSFVSGNDAVYIGLLILIAVLLLVLIFVLTANLVQKKK